MLLGVSVCEDEPAGEVVPDSMLLGVTTEEGVPEPIAVLVAGLVAAEESVEAAVGDSLAPADAILLGVGATVLVDEPLGVAGGVDAPLGVLLGESEGESRWRKSLGSIASSTLALVVPTV